MSDDKQGATGGDVAVKAVEAVEKMGGAVAAGVKTLAGKVEEAANRVVAEASGMAKQAYPQLVRRQLARGQANLICGLCAWVVTAVSVGVCISLLMYGLAFTGGVENHAGVARTVCFFVSVIAGIISLGVGGLLVGDAWPDLVAPEGAVINSLLSKFTGYNY